MRRNLNHLKKSSKEIIAKVIGIVGLLFIIGIQTSNLSDSIKHLENLMSRK